MSKSRTQLQNMENIMIYDYIAHHESQHLNLVEKIHHPLNTVEEIHATHY